MSTLEWIATPHPGTRHNDDESPSDYEKEPVFPAFKLIDSREIPMSILDEATSDMPYWQLETLASQIESFLAEYEDPNKTVLYSPSLKIRTILQESAEWLRYWSEEGKSVYVVC